MKLRLVCRDEEVAMKLAMGLRALEKDSAESYGRFVSVDTDGTVVDHVMDAYFDGRVEEVRG